MQVLGSFRNAQQIIQGKSSCIGIDYQVSDFFMTKCYDALHILILSPRRRRPRKRTT